MSAERHRREFGSVRRLASGRWQARYLHPISRVVHTGPTTFATKADANRYLSRVQSDLDRGAWHDPRVGRILFVSWCEQYEASSVHKRPTTVAAHRSVLRKHLIPVFGPRPVGSITPSDVQSFIQMLVGEGLKPSTVKTIYGLLRSIFSSAVANDLVIRSPCRGVKLPTRGPRSARALTMPELHRLAEVMPEDYRLMVYLGGVLGLRWSEIAGLRVGRVDLLGRKLQVVETAAQVGGFADVKTPESKRTLPLPRSIVEMLAEHLAQRRVSMADPGALVFVAPRGGRLWESNWHDRVWAPAVDGAGLRGYRFHWLRHTAVALMVEAGAHGRVIQARLGHASWATTMDTYGHILPATDDGVTDRLNDLLDVRSGTEMARPAGQVRIPSI